MSGIYSTPRSHDADRCARVDAARADRASERWARPGESTRGPAGTAWPWCVACHYPVAPGQPCGECAARVQRRTWASEVAA